MTDTSRPRSNAISPVVFMGSGGPDLTAPEAVEYECRKIHDAITRGAIKANDGVKWQDTLRALSAAHAGALVREQDANAKAMQHLRRAEAAEAKLKEAVDTAKQAIDVIASVQDYKQPDDPTEENALTMCEHEVFDFDVESARTFLASIEGDKP